MAADAALRFFCVVGQVRKDWRSATTRVTNVTAAAAAYVIEVAVHEICAPACTVLERRIIAGIEDAMTTVTTIVVFLKADRRWRPKSHQNQACNAGS